MNTEAPLAPHPSAVTALAYHLHQQSIDGIRAKPGDPKPGKDDKPKAHGSWADAVKAAMAKLGALGQEQIKALNDDFEKDHSEALDRFKKGLQPAAPASEEETIAESVAS